MKYNISKLTRGLSERENLSLKADFDRIVFHDEEYGLASPVNINGSIIRVGKSFELNLDIDFKYKDQCARCLKDLVEELNYNIESLLVNESYADEVSESESDIFFYEGEEFDIYDFVIHSLEFIMPTKVLCADDCRGICPTCGINLNLDTCNCEKDEENEADSIDPRFAKLQELLKD